MKHVIIVAGHAILRNPDRPLDEENWFLLPYQRGEPPKYVEHIRRGVELASEDPSALLVFSGGQTRRDAGPRSEAQSYFFIADHFGWFGCSGVPARAVTEEFARDSFENLLFGICRHREFTGRYPDYVTFVSWRFKQDRFELHREAIRWPATRYRYVGVNDPDALDQALAAEIATARGYRKDPYSSGPEYMAKRESRNPFLRRPGYLSTSAELSALFEHRGPEIFPGSLPWAEGPQ